MGKHTPEPWHSSPTHEGKAFDIGAADGSNVALVYAEEGDVENAATGKANAYLIKASPALYRELEHLVRLIEPALNGGTNIAGLATCNGALAALALARSGK